MKNNFFSLLFFFFFTFIYCQIPSSPEVANLFNFKAASASGSTGNLDFAVNLHTINVDNLDLPIVLQYNSNGIRIEDEASNVGTSWNLNAGGVINRNQNGLPDEFDKTYRVVPSYDSNGNVCQSVLLQSNVDFFSNSNRSNIAANYLVEHGNFIGYDQSTNGYTSYYNPEPDIFNYILPTGKRGSFMIKNSSTIICSTSDKVFLQQDSNGNLSKFTIVDDLGNYYFFEEIEKRNNSFWDSVFLGSIDSNLPIKPAQLTTIVTSVYGFIPCPEGNCYACSDPGHSAVSNKPTNVAWFISKIITVHRNEITYTYENERHARLSNTSILYDESVGNLQDLQAGLGRPFINSNRLDKFITKRLIKIKEPKGEVFFNYNPNKREDVRPCYNINGSYGDLFNVDNNYNELKALSSITIRDLNSNIIKNVNFLTSYRLSNGSNTAAPENIHLYKRLWLDEVNINNIEKYKFEYYTGTLPYKFSSEQDYWGYFNNNAADANVRTLLPDLWYYPTDPRSYSRPTNFSIFRRTTFTGTEYKLSTLPRFSDRLQNHYANRDIHESSIKIGMLEKVIYPTKGYEKFNYESNDFLYENELKKGFGLRIKSIEGFDNNNIQISSTTYNYLKPNGTSSGAVTGLNTFGRISKNDPIANQIKFKFSTNSFVEDAKLYYSRVEKVLLNNGKIISEYDIPFTIETNSAINNNGSWFYLKNFNIAKFRIECSAWNYCSSGSGSTWHLNLLPNGYEYPLMNLNSNYDSFFGKLLNEYIFNSSNIEVKRTENTYSISPSSTKFSCFFGQTANTTINLPIGSGDQYVKTFAFGESFLKDSKITEFNNNGSTYVVQNNFLYNSRNLLKESSYINSKGETIVTKIDYCDSNLFNFNFNYSDMKALNMINYPIIISTYKNNKLISKKFNRYNTNVINAPFVAINPGFLEEEFELAVNQPITDFNEFNWYDPFLPTFNTMDSRLKSKKVYHNYDLTNGNLREFSELGGAHTLYIWGYNKTKVIAKIENATYASIPTSTLTNLEILSNNDVDNCASSSCSEQLLRNALNALRSSLSDSLVTTFTYDPLIGLTSITDVKGETLYYSYDIMGRLTIVKDKDGNILSKNEYNFKQ